MEHIRCEVLTVKGNEEIHVGHIHVYFIPRVGEYIWFSKELEGHTSWIVEEVCHHVGSGDFSGYPLGYQSVVIYAKPTREAKQEG